MPRRVRSCGYRSKCPESNAATDPFARLASRSPSPRRSRVAVWSCHPPLERGGDRLMVAERQHLFADDLAGFVALAGDQQHVAAAQLHDRAADRLAAVADLDRAGSRLED